MRWKAGLAGMLVLLGLITCLEAGTQRVRRSCDIGWDAVTTNDDASALTDLAGYRIYTSTTSGSFGAHTLQVGSGTTLVTCRQLGLYTHNQQYYVRVTAIDTSDNESVPSSELTVVVTMGGAIFR